MNQVTRLADQDAAIMAVIARETDTYVCYDLEGWSSCWVQDDRTRLLSASSSYGTMVLEGWDAVLQYMKDVFDSGSTCRICEFRRENVDITFDGDLAFVVFEGRSRHLDGSAEHTFETRTLERVDGVWRILYASFVVRGYGSEDANRIAVDAKGMVLSAPERARQTLESHPGLQVSNGRLRAKRPAWDKILQAGLSCAAELHGFCQHSRFSTVNGRDFRLPLVLGEADDGGIVVCTLFVRDAVTWVEVRPEASFEDRLLVAKAVFGLSDGQVALARCILDGDSLTHAAGRLGISINTARTHLSRIYGKTGVNSQTALVRTLLSVG